MMFRAASDSEQVGTAVSFSGVGCSADVRPFHKCIEVAQLSSSYRGQMRAFPSMLEV